MECVIVFVGVVLQIMATCASWYGFQLSTKSGKKEKYTVALVSVGVFSVSSFICMYIATGGILSAIGISLLVGLLQIAIVVLGMYVYFRYKKRGYGEV